LSVALTLYGGGLCAQTDHATSAARQEARERFDQGLRLFNEGNNAGALAEFNRAYSLVPNPVVLYNVALVYAALGHPVEAVDALEEVLRSKTGLTDADRIRAEALHKEQSRRVAVLQLDNAPQGAVVELDGIQVGHAPLDKPLRVTVGTHIVSIVVPGAHPFKREATVAGGESSHIAIELVPIQRQNSWIAVDTQLPGADIIVDGKVVGTTPSAGTLTVTPGKHRVELRRTGYQLAVADTDVPEEGKNTVRLNPELDDAQLLATNAGTIRFKVREDHPSFIVDGRKVVGNPQQLRLPAGPHAIVVERSGFVSQRKNVMLPVGAVLDIDVALDPTPEMRDAYVTRTNRQKLWGWVAVGSGAGLALGGGVFTVYNNKKLNDAQSNYDAIVFQSVDHSGRNCDAFSASFNRAVCDEAITTRYDDLNQRKTYRTIGWVTTGVGAALAVTGVVLLLTNDDPSRYDRSRATTFQLPPLYPKFAFTSNSSWIGLQGSF
jgi:hypothetical protein